MSYDDFIEIIIADVSRILSDNSELIPAHLSKEINPDNLTADQIKLCENAVTASVQLSCQIIFSYLDSLGILDTSRLSEYHQKPEFRLIKGGLYEKPKN